MNKSKVKKIFKLIEEISSKLDTDELTYLEKEDYDHLIGELEYFEEITGQNIEQTLNKIRSTINEIIY